MFWNRFQIFDIIFDIEDIYIALCLKQNQYAFCHLEYSYLSSDMGDLTQPGKSFSNVLQMSKTSKIWVTKY